MNTNSHLVKLKDLKRHRLSGNEMRGIKQGDLVKICIESPEPHPAQNFVWIRIRTVTWPTFEGVFECELPNHGVSAADAITIEACHLIAIKSANRQDLERSMGAEMVLKSAEALECEEQPVTGTCCHLANGAMLLIERREDEIIGMITQPFSVCDTGKWTKKKYAREFATVVSDLMKASFPVQHDSESCTYAISVPSSATSAALLSKARKSQEAIHDLTRLSLGQKKA